MTFIGSLPSGVPDDFYARLTAAAPDTDVPVLVDAKGPPLGDALSERRPFLVKPNLEEAATTLDPSLDGDLDTRAAVTALTDAGARWALVSAATTGSLLGDASGNLWHVEPPRVETVHPIGSGDSLAAGLLLLALRRGASVPDAAAYGTACAAANALTPTSGVVCPADVAYLRPRVRLSKLSS